MVFVCTSEYVMHATRPVSVWSLIHLIEQALIAVAVQTSRKQVQKALANKMLPACIPHQDVRAILC